MYKAKVGDIVEGIGRKYGLYGRGEVVAVGNFQNGGQRLMAKVQYNNGLIGYHFAVDSQEIKFIGRKIPVLNLTDII